MFFWIVASRFRVLKTDITFNVNVATDVVQATCILHNLLRQRCGGSYMAPGTFDCEDIDYNLIPGEWRKEDEMAGLLPTSARNSTNISKNMRDNLSYYFLTDQGEVPWQYEQTRAGVREVLDDLM